jgi:hypothetical protein
MQKLQGREFSLIESSGIYEHATAKACLERASAITFFFPSMWKMRKSILDSKRIFTDAMMIGLYISSVRRELNIEKEVVELV